MCASFISSVWICSFRTLMRPSRLLFRTVLWFSSSRFSAIQPSSLRMAVSRRSYSSFKASDSRRVRSKSPVRIFFFSSTSAICLRIPSVSIRNWLASQTLSRSFSWRYSLAARDWRSKGPTCFSNSDRMSLTRTRLACSSSSFFWAMALRRLNFTIPAASSNSSLRSSGLPLKIRSIWPCPMME